MCSKQSVHQRKTSEIRKEAVNGEKRRARINDSLEELKKLVLDARKEIKREGKPSKLEKADILELTIEHLRSLKKEEGDESRSYRKGFQECADKVKRMVEAYENLEPTAKTRLLSYLFTDGPSSPQEGFTNLTLLPTKLATGQLAFLIPTRCLKLRCPSDNNKIRQDINDDQMWRPW